MIQIEKADFNDAIHQGVVIVGFFARFSNSSEILNPVIKEVITQFPSKIEGYQMNLDENMDFLTNYDIKTTPTVCIFKDGVPKTKIEGIHNKNTYKEELKKLF